MCNERERLIGFVYDETDARERAAIEAHLSECADCRSEIDGLKSVRQDLLAWSVPEHDPVWRPLAPARPTPTWRDVPAWMLAAAAAVVLCAGVSGAVASRLLLPPVAPASAMAANADAAVPASATVNAPAAQGFVTDAQLRALEQRLRSELHADLDRVELLVTHQRSRPAGSPALQEASSFSGLQDRIAKIEDLQLMQANINVEFEKKLNEPVSSRMAARNDGSIVFTNFAR